MIQSCFFLITFFAAGGFTALAEERELIPGSRVTIGKELRFPNATADEVEASHEGLRIKHRGHDSRCRIWALLRPGTNGFIPQGKSYVSIATPSDFSYGFHQRDVFLTPRLGIACEHYDQWLLDREGYETGGWVRTTPTEDLIRASLPFLSIVRKQNPDEEL